MLAYKPNYRTPETLAEIPTGFREATGLAFEEGLAYNPTTLIADVIKKKSSSADMITNKEANEIAKSLNVDISESLTGGDNAPIDRGAVYMLAERKYQSTKRQELLANGPSGIASLGSALTGNLAASFLDPIGFATNFIPFVREAKYAALLGKAGSSVIGRTAVRMGVGAIEGIGGNLLLEPIVYTGANVVGEDYTVKDSALSVAVGGIMGGTLHSVIGLPSDFREAAKFKTFEADRMANEAAKAASLKRKEELQRLREQQRIDEAVEEESIKQKYLEDLEKRQKEEFEQTIRENQDIFSFNNLTPAELTNVEHAATAMALAGKNIDAEAIVRLQVASKAARLEAARKIDPIAFKAVDDGLARIAELETLILGQKKQLEKSFPIYVLNRLSEIERQLSNQDISPKIRVELLKEESNLKKYTQTAFFERDILKEVEPSERQIDYLENEIKRIHDGLNSKDFNARISKAYHEAGKRINEGKIGDVMITNSDKTLTDFLQGRIKAEDIIPTRLVEKVNIDAEVNKHKAIWERSENNAAVDVPMLTKAQESKLKATKKELISLADEVNEIARDLEYTLKSYNITNEEILSGIESLKQSGKESEEIASALSACFVGVK